MDSPTPERNGSAARFAFRVIEFWPYVLIAGSVTGLAYVFLNSFH